MDDDVCGDDGVAQVGVPAPHPPAPAPLGRRRAPLEGNPTLFFVFGESGSLWSAQYRRAAAGSLFDDGVRRFFGVAVGKWKLVDIAAALQIRDGPGGQGDIIIRSSLHCARRLQISGALIHEAIASIELDRPIESNARNAEEILGLLHGASCTYHDGGHHDTTEGEFQDFLGVLMRAYPDVAQYFPLVVCPMLAVGVVSLIQPVCNCVAVKSRFQQSLHHGPTLRSLQLFRRLHPPRMQDAVPDRALPSRGPSARRRLPASLTIEWLGVSSTLRSLRHRWKSGKHWGNSL